MNAVFSVMHGWNLLIINNTPLRFINLSQLVKGDTAAKTLKPLFEVSQWESPRVQDPKVRGETDRGLRLSEKHENFTVVDTCY